MPYMCPQCDGIYPTWGTLKGHLIRSHKAEEYKQSTEEQLKDYAVTEEEAKERKRKKVLGEAAAITEVPTDPVERLAAILKVHRVDPEVTETVVNIFRLTPRLWGNPYELDDLLRPRVKPQSLVPSLVRHYMDGVEIPQETADRYGIPPRSASASPYYPGGEGGRGGEYPGYPRGRGSEPVTQADLLADRERQRLERDLEENRKKIQELESRLLSSTGPAAESKTMTIADERGNPIIIPYDPVYMDVLRREQEAKARKAEREEMIAQMVGLGRGGTDQEAIKAILKPLEEAVQAARAEAAEMRRKMEEQAQKEFERRAATAEERAATAERKAEEAKEMAAAAAKGDKTMADYLGEAGTEAKDAIQKAAKDVKDGLKEAGDRVASIVTGRAPTRREAPKSPGELAAIISAEDEFLAKLQPKGG